MIRGTLSILLLITTICAFLIEITNASFNCPARCHCRGTTVKCVDKGLLVIPDFKRVNKSLTRVDVSGNDIEEVRTTNLFSSKLISLEYLHLNDNSIMEIEGSAFSGLPNLRYLDLSNNLLEDVPSHAVHRNRKLEELNLSGNLFVSNTPELISTSLKTLDLSFSKISVFTENNIKDLPNLQVLYLHANSLKEVSFNIFLNIKLQHIDLSYNCWKCNCDTIKLFDHLVQRGLTKIDRPIQCMHPNKWYEEIYSSTGPMHLDKLCMKTESKVLHNDIIKPQKNPSLEIDHQVHSKNIDSEDFALFSVNYLVITLVVTGFILICVLGGLCAIFARRKPENKIYEKITPIDVLTGKSIQKSTFVYIE